MRYALLLVVLMGCDPAVDFLHACSDICEKQGDAVQFVNASGYECTCMAPSDVYGKYRETLGMLSECRSAALREKR